MSCPRCGVENPVGFRYCGACGAKLASVDVPRSVERKVISALFCDVVESTARAEDLDPEDVRAVLGPYYEGVRGQLVRMGGTVEKFIGDAVCGIFGAPRTFGDDPERAVRAALAIRDWVVEVNEANPQLALHLRLGIATGEALVALDARLHEGEGMAWGDVMNTAARLQASAPADAILVDERTYRATRHAIEYGEAEPVRAKGKNEPVLVWQALSPRARRGVDLAQEGSGRFVGREDELQLLQSRLDQVGRTRVPELVALVGEAGIGKSRLAFELFRWAEHRSEVVVWRQAGSSPYGDVLTYWALGEIVKAQAGILETDGANATARKLRSAVTDLVADPAEAGPIEAHLRSLVGLAAPAVTHGDQRQAAFVAWRRFLEVVAREYTLVLTFEDVQWADPDLLDFLEHVLDWSRGVGILVICTARPEFAELRPEWSHRERITMVPVSPLTNESVAELVTTAAPELPEQTRLAIVGAASGNPLFALEFGRMLVDRPDQPPAAESVRGVIAARLDVLSPEDKQLLQDAAVVGKAVWPGVLTGLGRSRRRVEAQLRGLARKAFLTRVSPSSVQGEAEFRFRHDLVRDVAYEQIPRARRAEAHRRTAEWLDSLSPDRTKDRAEMLALHYVAAYEYAAAANADTSGLVERVRVSLRDAGDRALALNSFATAERYYREALELWPEDDPERADILLRLGKSLYFAERKGAELFSEAEPVLLEARGREAAAEAAMFLARLAHQDGQPRERVLEHADRAIALVDGCGPSRSRVEVLIDRASIVGLAAEHEQAIAFAREALRDAEALELRELEADALAMIGMSRALTGDLDGRADLQRSIEIKEEIGSASTSHSYGMLADLECSLGNLEPAFELHASARAHAERFGLVASMQWLMAEQVAEEYWRGHWPEALRLADDYLIETSSSAGHFMEPYCRAVRGRIRLAQDDIEGALEDTERALALATESRDPQLLFPALGVRARVLAASDDVEGATASAAELLAGWSAKRDQVPAASWVVDLAFALDALGRSNELVESVDGLAGSTRWIEAALAFARGDFRAAADLFAAIGTRPDEALARKRAAEQMLEAGRTTEATTELSRALAFYRDVAAAAYLRDAEALAV